MPGQVSELFPLKAAQIISYGHFICALFALLAVSMTWHKIKGASFAIWLFSLIGIADIVIAFLTGLATRVLEMEIGFNLYIVNFYMPMVIVSHVLIIMLLVKKKTLQT